MRGHLLPRKVGPAAGEGSEERAWGRTPARRRRESPGLPSLATAAAEEAVAVVEARRDTSRPDRSGPTPSILKPDATRGWAGLFIHPYSVFGLCLPPHWSVRPQQRGTHTKSKSLISNYLSFFVSTLHVH
jgi:hypothetical protein